LLNALSGVWRPSARTRSAAPDAPAVEATSPATTRRLHRRAIGVARFCADCLTGTPRARQRALATFRSRARATVQPARAVTRRRLHRRHVLLRLTTDRAIPLSVALVVLIAAGVSLAPAAAPVGATQPEAPAPAGVRLTVGGGAGGPNEFDGPTTVTADAAAAPIDDATLYKPVAVDTSVATSVGKLRHYTVRNGDTLTGIANRFGVSMMTVWWANHMTSRDSMKAGDDLVIPPVNGLVITVKAGDTVDSLAAANKISADDIVTANELTDTNLIVGQVLMLPGAKGAPMPTPPPAPKVSSGGGGGGGSGSGGTGPAPRVTGSWAWPVIGGGNYISQYFHYGHYGIDVAADYGSPIVAPAAGKVIFAGWKSNGGGNQVWLALDNGLFTTEYHMSAVSVAAGQTVAKGQRVGKVGTSGWASGSHVMLEVWVGTPWDSGSYRVNPLKYY
jgi:murein DD-endopeptidase MepM/ murein hydrolase activator NlpD